MAEERHGASKDPAVNGMSRRQFVTHALGVGLSAASTAAFLAGCSGGGNPEGGSVPFTSADRVRSVRLLGHGDVEWAQVDEGLRVRLPETGPAGELNCLAIQRAAR